MSKDPYCFIAIDLKSFYASVECVERGLDPLKVHLVVADKERTEKTICLAVTPALKAYGVPGRARLFEVIEKVKGINATRQSFAPGGTFTGSSWEEDRLQACPELSLDFIIAPPRMAKYLEYSNRIYEIYLKYVSPEDCHVYSIDEIFMDVSQYLNTYQMTAKELASRMIKDVYESTGITATAGVGTNLYLCKVAMDMLAKHAEPDENGVRIAVLDELSYRKRLWCHQPITDFWRVGRGYAAKLKAQGLLTMGDVARCSMGSAKDYYNEDLLYRMFGVNAELLIDHAWGWEPCTMKAVKDYRPEAKSVSSGQVLHCPYTFEKARLIVREMTDQLVLDLVEKGLMTDQLVLTAGYDIENLSDPMRRSSYQGAVRTDHYGRQVPWHAHGTVSLPHMTSSSREIMEAMTRLYEQIVNPSLLIRRVTITANHVQYEETVEESIPQYEQMDLFTDYKALEEKNRVYREQMQREKNLQYAILDIRRRFGKNALLRGMDLEDGATAMDRNRQIGGHRA